MTALDERDRAYLARRTRMLRWWPWAAGVLLVAILGLWGTLFLSRSLLVNPWVLLERLEANDVSQGTLAALALLGSMGFLVLGIVMLAVLALLWAAARNERRLLAMLRKLQS